MRNSIIGLLIGLSLGGIASFAKPHFDHFRLTQGQTASAEDLNVHVFARLDALERKMRGVQKQITILHAKKADIGFMLDGTKLEATTDQVEAKVDAE